MESLPNSGSSVDLRGSNSTNSGEGEQFKSENKQVTASSSPFSSQLTSQDHLHFMPNATTWSQSSPPGAVSPPKHDHKFSQSKMQHTHSGTEKGDRNPINSHLEAHHANPFGEAHPSPSGNYSAPTSSSSSQNPFLMPSDATNTTNVDATEAENLHDHLHSLPPMQQENKNMKNNGLSTYHDDDMFGFHSSMSPSTYESQPGNPFEVPTSTTSKETRKSASVSWKLDEHHHDHDNESHHHTPPSMEQGHGSMPSHEARSNPTNNRDEAHVSSSIQNPFFPFESTQNQLVTNANDKNHKGDTIRTTFESHHAFPATEQGHHSNSSSNLGTDKELGSSMSSYPQASESSTQDPMHNSANAVTKDTTHNSIDDDILNNSSGKHSQQSSDVSGQRSPVPAVPSTNNGSEKQNPPLQVMERPEDPTASSKYRFPSHVFSRHKSNTQWSAASNESLFSIQMGNMSFSSEMAGLTKSGEFDANPSSPFPNSQHSPLPPHPQTSPTKFTDISQSTAKQHEGSKVTEEKAAETMREVIMESSVNKHNISKVDLTTAAEATGSHNRSPHSNGSTKSFAFDVLTDGDKTLSSKRGGDKKKQQKLPEQQTPKATPDEGQNPKSNPNASKNKWLSCFSCCN